MTWLDPLLDELAAMPAIGYSPSGKAAAEPMAIASLALLQHGRNDAAVALASKLAEMQQDNGEVAVRAGEDWPGWPTSLAVVTWCAVRNALSGVPSVNSASRENIQSAARHTSHSFQEPIARAIDWLLVNRGRGVERSENFGHNTELVGWAYAEGTHSWIEPTSFAVLAMKAAAGQNAILANDKLEKLPDDKKKRDLRLGYGAMIREGIAVLIDRQLPGGGLNYGNTIVLGQTIRPHIQPTGIALLALAGEEDPSGRLAKSIAWLRRSIGPTTTPSSLAWAVLGLTAHGAGLEQAGDWLAAAADRVKSRDRSPHKLALLALAAKGWPQ